MRLNPVSLCARRAGDAVVVAVPGRGHAESSPRPLGLSTWPRVAPALLCLEISRGNLVAPRTHVPVTRSLHNPLGFREQGEGTAPLKAALPLENEAGERVDVAFPQGGGPSRRCTPRGSRAAGSSQPVTREGSSRPGPSYCDDTHDAAPVPSSGLTLAGLARMRGLVGDGDGSGGRGA